MGSNYPTASAVPILPLAAAAAAPQAMQAMPHLQPVALPPQVTIRDLALSDTQWATLQGQGYTRALAVAMAQNRLNFPLSIWILDNSASTATQDGHRLVELPSKRGQPQRFKMVPCTRWAELRQTVEYHVQRAALLRQPTVFRLLNDPGPNVGPQQFSIAERNDPGNVDHEVAVAQSTVRNVTPAGVTPLTQHLREIHRSVVEMQTKLQRNGTKVAIIIATDGLPSDELGETTEATKRDFVDALKSLVSLPVWIVVRLCTDDKSVVSFWNDLDDEEELALEVLDDFRAEAAEVQAHNPWLNYGLPLHRMREAGFHSKLFDILDEDRLNKDEVASFLQFLFGTNDMPDPQADWNAFCDAVARAVAGEQLIFNPLSQTLEPWINVKKLRGHFRRKWLGI